jgi:hypothetical protein
VTLRPHCLEVKREKLKYWGSTRVMTASRFLITPDHEDSAQKENIPYLSPILMWCGGKQRTRDKETLCSLWPPNRSHREKRCTEKQSDSGRIALTERLAFVTVTGQACFQPITCCPQ